MTTGCVVFEAEVTSPALHAERFDEPNAMGGEVRIFDPTGLPLPDGAPDTPTRCRSCASATWSEGTRGWSGPRRSGMAP